MPQRRNNSAGNVALLVSILLLVVGMGIEGRLGIALNAAAIVGFVVSIVLLVRGGGGGGAGDDAAP